jgi:hypothetical protein
MTHTGDWDGHMPQWPKMPMVIEQSGAFFGVQSRLKKQDIVVTTKLSWVRFYSSLEVGLDIVKL